MLFLFRTNMPVRRFYRRTTRVRKSRRNFSMYNLYRKRSNASQARQIYGLNKRINAIQRRNKPEIKLIHSNASDTISFGNTGLVAGSYPLLNSGDSALLSVIDGKFARLNSMKFTMSFRYEDPSAIQYGDDASLRLPQPIYLRLVFVQFKASRQGDISAEDLFDTTTGFTRTRGPLADGSARIVKILSDKKYMIGYNNQTVNKVVNFRYLRNFYKPANETFAKGDIRLYVQAWNPNLTVTDKTTNVILTFNVKVAYTDA